MYSEEEYLQLSGIQHYCFCKRQWALIHIENAWEDDARTMKGNIIHKNVDDPFFREKRKNVTTIRSFPVSSATLGLNGICDLVEFISDDGGAVIKGLKGTYKVHPVEYKVGSPKKDKRDGVQLCAQAIALEEMLGTTIESGSLYYYKNRRRTVVDITNELRNHTKTLADEMHEMFQSGITPKVKPSSVCEKCSLSEICIPNICTKYSVEKYIKEIKEDEI